MPPILPNTCPDEQSVSALGFEIWRWCSNPSSNSRNWQKVTSLEAANQLRRYLIKQWKHNPAETIDYSLEILGGAQGSGAGIGLGDANPVRVPHVSEEG